MKKITNNINELCTIIMFALSFIFPCSLASEKMDIVNIEVSPNYEGHSFSPAMMMNNAMFHKILIDIYGKDEYYNILKRQRKNHQPINLFLSGNCGQFEELRVNLDWLQKSYYYEIMRDANFIDKIRHKLLQAPIFEEYAPGYNDGIYEDGVPKHTFIMYTISFRSSYIISPNNKHDIDTLDKESYLKAQIHRLDSILNQDVYYYRDIRGPRYNSKETPFFNDSILFNGSILFDSSILFNESNL